MIFREISMKCVIQMVILIVLSASTPIAKKIAFSPAEIELLETLKKVGEFSTTSFGEQSRQCMQLKELIVSSGMTLVDQKDSPTTTEMPESRNDNSSLYRLPKNTVPRVYNILIEPNMDDEHFTWTGEISIHIKVIHPTSVLTLHAHENLVIDELFTRLVDDGGLNLKPLNHDRDDVLEFLELRFDHNISVGQYRLILKFNGSSISDPYGFLKHKNGNKSTTVTTSLEPVGARRVFPCWDEPALKARFNTTIKHDRNYSAFSNMPEVARVETLGGKFLTVFETTPIMSTYLLNLVVTNAETVFNNYRNISVHGPENLPDNGKQLLDLTARVVSFMESYTRLPVGVPKIGSLIFPTQFGDGMEQWGLITYSKASLPFNTSVSQTTIANITIAHELIHSWFGNRVTARWWNEIWLTEGFTTYLSIIALDKIFNGWGGPSYFVLFNNRAAYFTDDEKQLPVRTENPKTDVAAEFAVTRYGKAAAIIHMFCNILGEKVCRDGLRTYLAKHSFKTAVTKDLMIEMQSAYDNARGKRPLNLEQKLTPWLTQIGHPIVNVMRNYTSGDMEISQISSVGNSFNRWWIPVTYATESNPNFTSTVPITWISDKKGPVKFDGIDENDWIILNVQASGFYQVNYDDENWMRIARYLHTDNYTSIHVLNRVQLITDALYFAYHDPDHYCTIFHNIITYLSREVESPPWILALEIVQNFSKLKFTGFTTCKPIKPSIIPLLNRFIRKIGLDINDTDDHLTKLLKNQLALWVRERGNRARNQQGCSSTVCSLVISKPKHQQINDSNPCTVVVK